MHYFSTTWLYVGMYYLHRYGMGTGPIHIYNLQCEGFEDDLIDCDHDPAQFAVCNHKDDVGIVCGKYITVFY